MKFFCIFASLNTFFMKALIIGATGATGKDLLLQLLADDTYT